MTADQAALLLTYIDNLNNTLNVFLTFAFAVAVIFVFRVLYWLFGKVFFGGV